MSVAFKGVAGYEKVCNTYYFPAWSSQIHAGAGVIAQYPAASVQSGGTQRNTALRIGMRRCVLPVGTVPS